MRVAIVQNSKVIAEKPLAQVRHHRISNLATLKPRELVKYGVFPIEEVQVTHDRMYQTKEYVYEIKSDRVIKRFSAVDLPIETVQRRYNEMVSNKINELLLLGHVTTSTLKMDSTQSSVQLLESGYQLALRAGAPSMTIRDYNNTSHPNIILADVATMVEELAGYVATKLYEKWALQDSITGTTTAFDAMTAGDAAVASIQAQIDALVV